MEDERLGEDVGATGGQEGTGGGKTPTTGASSSNALQLVTGVVAAAGTGCSVVGLVLADGLERWLYVGFAGAGAIAIGLFIWSVKKLKADLPSE